MDINDDTIIKYLAGLEVKFLCGKFYDCDAHLKFEDSTYYTKNMDLLQFLIKSLVSHDTTQILKVDLTNFGISFNCSFDCNLQVTVGCTFNEDEINVKDSRLSIYVKQCIQLFIGVAALQQFVIANISGPHINESNQFNLCTTLLPDDKFSCVDVFKFLSRNGESPLSVTAQLKLLCLSKILLSHCETGEDVTVSRRWWLARCNMIHQLLIPERIFSLHDEMLSLFDQTFHSSFLTENSTISIRVLLCVERAQMFLFYHEVTAAQNLIEEAQKLVGLSIELSGAYGKRTQFQQRALPQLTVKLNRSIRDAAEPFSNSLDAAHFPADLHLQDDTVLNKVSFVDGSDNQVPTLTADEQIVLLAHCCKVLRGEAFDEILKEKVAVYVNSLLAQPRVWAIYLKALVMRCKLEKMSARRVERSLMQLEAVVNSIKKEPPPFPVREPFLYASAFPTVWTLERDLADLWMSVGGTQSALDIYERLGAWEDVVACHKVLGRTSCAEALLRQKLQQEGETPLLLCLLGEVRDDPRYYLRAYEVSGGTSARSQRSLAFYYYRRKEFRKCVPFFQRALKINPLQGEAWFSLGFAATQVKQFELAVTAYRQVVNLDGDKFQAWNNLANAHLQCGRKDRAWRCFSEALKCNYEDWRVWENFLAASTDVGAFEDVLRAFHRLLDLRGRHADPQVLRILVRAVNEDLPDNGGQPASRLRPAALRLLCRITSCQPSDPVAWECYSLLQCPDPAAAAADPDSLERALRLQQKALQGFSRRWQDGGGSREAGLCRGVLGAARRCVELAAAASPEVRRGAWSRLAVQPVLLRVERSLENFAEGDRGELEALLEQVWKAVRDIPDSGRGVDEGNVFDVPE